MVLRAVLLRLKTPPLLNTTRPHQPPVFQGFNVTNFSLFLTKFAIFLFLFL